MWDDRENFERWNPINHISNWSTPHLVTFGSLDYRVPETEGIALFNILQERGVPSKLLNFPDEAHSILNKENSLVWYQEVFKWVNYYSGLSEDEPL